MCTPVMALAGVGIAAGIAQGAAAASATNTRAANQDTQAQLQDRQAGVEEEAGAYEAARLSENVARAIGDQRAQYAANGIALTGSAADVINESALEGALDVEAIRWNSDIRADNLRMEAKVSRSNAADTRSSAGLRFLTPVLGSTARFGGAFIN